MKLNISVIKFFIWQTINHFFIFFYFAFFIIKLIGLFSSIIRIKIHLFSLINYAVIDFFFNFLEISKFIVALISSQNVFRLENKNNKKLFKLKCFN